MTIRTRARQRALRLAATLAAVTLLATACGGGDDGGGGGSDGGGASSGPASGEITIWARDSQQGFMSQLVDLFNASHQVKAKVTIIPNASFVQKLGTAAAAGSGPDVSSIDLVYAPYFASAGALEDITDLADSLPYKDSLSPSHRRLSTYEDRTYALPFTAEASAVYYNKDLFKKAGIANPPTTYAEMRDDAKKIRALGSDYYGFTFAGACGGCNVFEFAPHVWASGGDVLSEDGKQALLDSPAVTDALGLYRGMWEDGSVSSASKNDAGTQQIPLFTSGKVGMITLGAFAIPSIEKAKVDFGVTPIPGKDGGTSSFAGGDVISVISGTKNEAGAREFVKWATDTEAQTFLAKNGSVPVRTDLVPSIYASQGEPYKVFGELMASGRTPYSTVENAVFNDNNGPWAKMINDAVFGPDLATAQATGQKSAQSLIDAG
ncbi:carbohydrate ABC transporter substrate-binding protein, CUT1 family [Microlunatus sagamiharensis]|uniref:Carbohydrate ABC transporter substrate-binding protein, CUT1 family n=1 Tax=Microlunatus sagamiharensis TaxID=546874 RepID=A0A1H2NCU4_9ACTN|nr:sugar ABC transporter substrate-binding protein [Microlunatus sagamiharensis]SDV02676.1 carbohydrate ABC transporter substrate-binding protein, CUT1 family [Microlunatus sagamiharensis]